MAWDWTLYDAFRNHDQAVYDWLGELKVDYGEISGQPFPSDSILRIFATPDNAFAKMADVLIRKGWVEYPTHAETLDAADAYYLVPLPFASVYRSIVETYADYANVPGFYKQFAYNRETGKYEKHRYPGMYQITYDIDFWCLKKYTEAHIYEWIMSYMGKLGSHYREMMLTVKHGDPWGDKLHGFKLDSFVDNSEIEGIEADRRYLRFTATMSLNAFLFRPPEEGAKPVLRVSIDHHDSRTADGITTAEGEHLEQQTVETAYFRDNGCVPNSLLPNFFDLQGSASIKRSKLTPDGRIDTFTGKPTNGRYGAFHIEASPRDTVADEALMLPDGTQYMVFRFNYLSPQEPYWFSLTDGSGVELQRWNLPQTKKWKRFEAFAVLDNDLIGIRFEAAGTGISNFHFDDVRFSFLNVGPILTPDTDTVVGGSRVLHFDNLNKNRPYLLYAYPLNPTTDIDILIGDAGANPLLTTRIPVVSGAWSNVAAVIQPRDTGSASIIFENEPAPAPAHVEARVYYGSKTGTIIPYTKTN